MRKDRLLLMLLLACFTVLAACNDEDDPDIWESKNLPERANAASPLLRTYFRTLTTPAGMTDVKIPEDRDMIKQDGPLRVKFDMGGNVAVNDLRVRLRICGPVGTQASACELQARMIAPNGTASGWKNLDFATGDLIEFQTELVFWNDFNGVLSNGTWVLELIDAVDDNDGRCVFRNGTLRINLGETPGLTDGQSQTVDLALGSQAYTYLPELMSVRDHADWGYFGMARVLKAQFNFTQAFFVRGFVLEMNLLVKPEVDVDTNIIWGLCPPSGGWLVGRLDSSTALTTTVESEAQVMSFAFGASTAFGMPESFPLRGEPSAGVWTLVLWDALADSNIAALSTYGTDGVDLIANAPTRLTLLGAS